MQTSGESKNLYQLPANETRESGHILTHVGRIWEKVEEMSSKRNTGIREEESRVIDWNDGTGNPICVALPLKELNECLPHSVRRPLLLHLRHDDCPTG